MADPRSLAGTPYFNGPGQYGDVADTQRRQAAQPLSDLIAANPSFKRKYGGEQPSANYLAGGLPYDVEGLLSAYALKFGQEKAMVLLEVLPHLNAQDLLEVQKSVSQAASESDSMRNREYGAYERAGAPAK